MEIGQIFYYQSGGSKLIHRAECLGETSRSWLIGIKWHPDKIAKKTTIFKTEEDYNLQNWASKHRYEITRAVHNATSEQLKAVAVMVGYVEKE